MYLLLSLSGSLWGQAVEGTLLGTWDDPTLVSSTAHDNTYNEIWGTVVNGREIAIIGTTRGTHFIDVTDPTAPEELHVVDGGSSGTNIIHRDYHDYRGYLYAVADEGGQSSLQIIDMQYLPDSVVVVYDDNSLISRTHNIFIDTAKATLYSLSSTGADLGFESMRIFDISEPLEPILVGEYDQFGGVNFNHVHDAYVRNDTAYLNLGFVGFAMVVFDDYENPNVVGVLRSNEYAQSGYNHSGWPTEDGKYYYMADETFGKDMKVVDLTELPDIQVTGFFNAESPSSATIPHNQIVHNGKLYVAYYYDGLQVYDLTDPANPVREMYYPTSTLTPTNGLYRGAWGVYPFLPSGNILVSDMQNGLFVVSGELPTNTVEYNAPSFELYPNPTDGNFRIQTGKGDWKAYEIRRIDGTLIKSGIVEERIEEVKLHVSEGIYIVRLENGGISKTEKLIVRR